MVGSGANNAVFAIVAFNQEIFAGGIFQMIDSKQIPYLARYTGNEWASVGNDGPNGAVYVLTVYSDGVSKDVLYVGGVFDSVDGLSSPLIAKWDSMQWIPMKGNLDGYSVNAIHFYGSTLLVGGVFPDLGSIVQWNGTDWQTLGVSGVDGAVDAIQSIGNDVFIGGLFVNAGNISSPYLTRWDGNNFNTVGSTPLNLYVSSLATDGTNLFIGGAFSNNSNLDFVRGFDGNDWFPLGTGVDAKVEVIFSANGTLYVGGYFLNAGTIPVNHVAKFDGNNWSALMNGTDNIVDSIFYWDWDYDLYIGGLFDYAGNVNSRGITLYKC